MDKKLLNKENPVMYEKGIGKETLWRFSTEDYFKNLNEKIFPQYDLKVHRVKSGYINENTSIVLEYSTLIPFDSNIYIEVFYKHEIHDIENKFTQKSIESFLKSCESYSIGIMSFFKLPKEIEKRTEEIEGIIVTLIINKKEYSLGMDEILECDKDFSMAYRCGCESLLHTNGPSDIFRK